MAALTSRGLSVQPFKVGPDFIDPTHHTAICHRPSRNLDPFMMGEEGVRDTFALACRGADIAVIEGVMGLYDGLDGGDAASTAHVAKLLCAPVALVVDVRGMSRSAHALIRGYRAFDPDINIAGVVFNRVGSERHRSLIDAAGRENALGWVPRRDDMAVASRHLGLRMAIEEPAMERFGSIVEESCDVDRIIDTAGRAPELPDRPVPFVPAQQRVRIGVAQDAAFCFYYQDNLERLARTGADLTFFSPAADRLPDVDLLYLGGGYPELHARELSESRCRHDVKCAVECGMPVYAECGGLVYLTDHITTENDYPMTGVLPARAEMTERVQGLGYVQARAVAGPHLIEQDMEFCGHEFHYSRIECDRDARFALELSRGKGIADGKDGLYAENAIGQYTHAYFTDAFAASLIAAAERYRVG